MLKDLLTQDQRLVILRSLADAGYDANESIISDCLDLYGHDISRDLVRNHLNWLEEQGLVKVQRLQDGYMVATITRRGLDVSQGRAFVDGVKRPRPKI
ncbi:winged-helix domain-containing protein [Pasteurella multocida]|uniref:VpaChn25_0724 family phage protein n=1 Tax=Pasteurella multocida TaxID=747 RepID=UPI0029BEB61A|nr:winged-helix domain-containing protein [Pasteurella multocida]MDX3962161.1 winged-helix domain-containing protein [Pasteurella multocida]